MYCSTSRRASLSFDASAWRAVRVLGVKNHQALTHTYSHTCEMLGFEIHREQAFQWRGTAQHSARKPTYVVCELYSVSYLVRQSPSKPSTLYGTWIDSRTAIPLCLSLTQTRIPTYTHTPQKHLDTGHAQNWKRGPANGQKGAGRGGRTKGKRPGSSSSHSPSPSRSRSSTMHTSNACSQVNQIVQLRMNRFDDDTDRDKLDHAGDKCLPSHPFRCAREIKKARAPVLTHILTRDCTPIQLPANTTLLQFPPASLLFSSSEQSL